MTKDRVPSASVEFNRWLQGLNFSVMPAMAMSAAAELGLFGRFSVPVTPREVAQESGYDERGLEILADALAGLEVLDKRDGKYSLTETARLFLGTDEVHSFEPYLLHLHQIVPGWLKMAEVIRRGTPVERQPDDARFINLTLGLGVSNRALANRLCRQWPAPAPRKILDVGCGAASWSRPFVENEPEARGFALDRPAVIKGAAKVFLGQMGLLERYAFIDGDYWETDWGQDYDLIVLGHLCHSLGPDQIVELFRLAKASLAPGGRVAVIDFVADEARQERLFPLLFALNMLVHTRQGRTYTAEEYGSFTKKAGLTMIDRIDLTEAIGLAALVGRAG
jgi:SAM-dependent methyltransferase